ncbi:MAG: hypothetical protein IKE18_03765 [Oscillospiraceae bacterium]|nr:hypothetical protein [Oscillospiraceae bacterium]
MDLMTITSYSDLKEQLHQELSRTATGFVRIGYLLKKARDTDILQNEGYKNVNEFASAEFGLDKTQVSRFIRINDRFSEGGNSDKIQEKYAQYGSAKLSLMLTLPDEINEELSPEMSKTDIQAIKEEYDEEAKISPIELACEEKPEDEPDEFIDLVVKHLNDEHPEPAELMKASMDRAKKFNIEIKVVDAKENYIPDGDKIYNIRIEGQGRFMVSMKDDGITITNMRDPGNKSTVSWDDFLTALLQDLSQRDFSPEKEEKPKEKPKKVEKSKAQKEKVAPVQPKTEKKEPENYESPTENQEVEKVEGEIMPPPVAPTACQPSEPVKVWDEEQAAGEATVEAAGENQTEAAGEITALRQQVVNLLEQVKNEVVHGESWETIRDHVRDISKFITLSAF